MLPDVWDFVKPVGEPLTENLICCYGCLMAQFRTGTSLTGGTHCESRNGSKNDGDLSLRFSILPAALRVVCESIFNQVCNMPLHLKGEGFPNKNPNDGQRSHLMGSNFQWKMDARPTV